MAVRTNAYTLEEPIGNDIYIDSKAGVANTDHQDDKWFYLETSKIPEYTVDSIIKLKNP